MSNETLFSTHSFFSLCCNNQIIRVKSNSLQNSLFLLILYFNYIFCCFTPRWFWLKPLEDKGFKKILMISDVWLLLGCFSCPIQSEVTDGGSDETLIDEMWTWHLCTKNVQNFFFFWNRIRTSTFIYRVPPICNSSLFIVIVFIYFVC